jgi:hypothetical protein
MRGRKLQVGEISVTLYVRHSKECSERKDNSGTVGCKCIRWVQYLRMASGKARVNGHGSKLRKRPDESLPGAAVQSSRRRSLEPTASRKPLMNGSPNGIRTGFTIQKRFTLGRNCCYGARKAVQGRSGEIAAINKKL